MLFCFSVGNFKYHCLRNVMSIAMYYECKIIAFLTNGYIKNGHSCATKQVCPFSSCKVGFDSALPKHVRHCIHLALLLAAPNLGYTSALPTKLRFTFTDTIIH